MTTGTPDPLDALISGATDPAATDPAATASGATSPGADQDISPDLVRGPDGLLRPPWATGSELLREYYDTEWGVPVHSERGLFERIALESFQSGLSWEIVLRKRPALREVFCDFDPDTVAAFGDDDIARLLADARIIRNRAKIDATIGNARATVALREHGGLAALIWSHRPAPLAPLRRLADIPTQSRESAALATALRAQGFRFVGPTTMFALMEAIGMVDTRLIGAHRGRSSSSEKSVQTCTVGVQR